MSSAILVPLDGSRWAERALPLAECLARSGARRLVLARAAELFLPDGEVCVESEHPILSEISSYLQHIADRLVALGLQVECVVPHRAPVVEIPRLVRSCDAELVVMSTHGRSGLGRWLYGSVADAILLHSSAPVALVPPAVTAPVRANRMSRLLVPLDGSELSESVLALAVDLATRMRAELLLVQVVPLPYVYPGVAEIETAALEQQLVEVRAYLESVAKRSSGELTIRSRAEVSSAPATRIARLAQDEHADMIVMATHGRSGVGRLVLGSVANGTLRHSTVPVVVVNPTRSTAPAARAAVTVEQRIP